MNASLKPIDAFAPPHRSSAHQFKDARSHRPLEPRGFCDHAVPEGIRYRGALDAACGEALTETEALARLRAMIGENEVLKSFIGMGYYGTHAPVIQRNVLENQGGIRNTRYRPRSARGVLRRC